MLACERVNEHVHMHESICACASMCAWLCDHVHVRVSVCTCLRGRRGPGLGSNAHRPAPLDVDRVIEVLSAVEVGRERSVPDVSPRLRSTLPIDLADQILCLHVADLHLRTRISSPRPSVSPPVPGW